MGKVGIFTGIFFLGFVIIASSCSAELLCEPVVVVSNIDYVGQEYDLPYGEIHDEFAVTYSGADLSVSLRNDLIEVMENKADSLGEDPDVLYECVKATYEDWSERPDRIPCYAEKCLYDNEPVWAIAFNRANGFESQTLEHIDFFYMSCSRYDILYYGGCYGE